MAALTVFIDGELKDLTEKDVKERLIDRALDVARNTKMRWYLSEVGRAMQSIHNQVYEGRQRVLRNYGHIDDPFPEATKLMRRLVDLMQDYCMKQEDMAREDWEAGWETEVVPKIRALR